MKIKVLYTIPNFDTAGSGIVLYKLLSVIDTNIFEPEVVCLHDKGELFKKVVSLGFPVHVLQYTHPMRPVIDGVLHCWKVSRFFKSRKYDIIYSLHYHADYSEPVAAKLAGAKWVFVKKNMGWFGPNLRAWKLRSFLADWIIVQNTDMIKEFYQVSSKVQLIPIGVDTNEYFPRKKNIEFKLSKGFKPEDKIIISVSSLIPIKGVDTIIEAFLSISSSYPDLKLLIIGDESTDFAKELRGKYLGVNIMHKKIFFLGKQTNISEWLNISDLFIQATRNEGRREGAPIALQEAMASGCIVLGSNVSGIRDQLDSFDELIFNAGNYSELAEKISYVLSLTESKRNTIIQSLLQRIEERYSLNIEKAKHEQMLKKILKWKE